MSKRRAPAPKRVKPSSNHDAEIFEDSGDSDSSSSSSEVSSSPTESYFRDMFTSGVLDRRPIVGVSSKLADKIVKLAGGNSCTKSGLKKAISFVRSLTDEDLSPEAGTGSIKKGFIKLLRAV